MDKKNRLTLGEKIIVLSFTGSGLILIATSIYAIYLRLVTTAILLKIDATLTTICLLIFAKLLSDKYYRQNKKQEER